MFWFYLRNSEKCGHCGYEEFYLIKGTDRAFLSRACGLKAAQQVKKFEYSYTCTSTMQHTLQFIQCSVCMKIKLETGALPLAKILFCTENVHMSVFSVSDMANTIAARMFFVRKFPVLRCLMRSPL